MHFLYRPSRFYCTIYCTMIGDQCAIACVIPLVVSVHKISHAISSRAVQTFKYPVCLELTQLFSITVKANVSPCSLNLSSIPSHSCISHLPSLPLPARGPDGFL